MLLYYRKWLIMWYINRKKTNYYPFLTYHSIERKTFCHVGLFHSCPICLSKALFGLMEGKRWDRRDFNFSSPERILLSAIPLLKIEPYKKSLEKSLPSPPLHFPPIKHYVIVFMTQFSFQCVLKFQLTNILGEIILTRFHGKFVLKDLNPTT